MADTLPLLTATMRAWLSDMATSRALSTRGTIVAFIKEFGLTPSKAGELLIQWILETGE